MHILLALLLARTLPTPAPEAPRPEAPPPQAVVSGIAQDGGVPHAGCHQTLCADARADPAKRRLVASLGLVDPAAGKRFLIDATPDFAEQMERLGGLPDGVLLTHAHIGHVVGLLQLGREVLGAKRVPVYCTASMAKFLRENRPWSRLVSLENIEIREIAPDRELVLTDRLRVTALRVPHRDEDSDTVAFLVRGPDRSLLWLPDIDKWEKWDRSLPELLGDPRLTAFVDGTFFSADEIPGRSIEQIPHPLVPETATACRARRPPAGFFWSTSTTRTVCSGIEKPSRSWRKRESGSRRKASASRCSARGVKIQGPWRPPHPTLLPFFPGAARQRGTAPVGPRGIGAWWSGAGCGCAARFAERAGSSERTSPCTSAAPAAASDSPASTASGSARSTSTRLAWRCF